MVESQPLESLYSYTLVSVETVRQMAATMAEAAGANDTITTTPLSLKALKLALS